MTLPHKWLLSKLKAFGFNSKLLKWTESFLSDRMQQVVVSGSLTQWCTLRKCAWTYPIFMLYK